MVTQQDLERFLEEYNKLRATGKSGYDLRNILASGRDTSIAELAIKWDQYIDRSYSRKHHRYLKTDEILAAGPLTPDEEDGKKIAGFISGMCGRGVKHSADGHPKSTIGKLLNGTSKGKTFPMRNMERRYLRLVERTGYAPLDEDVADLWCNRVESVINVRERICARGWTCSPIERGWQFARDEKAAKMAAFNSDLKRLENEMKELKRMMAAELRNGSR